MRPEKDTINPPGQVVNKLTLAALQDARPLKERLEREHENGAREYLEGLLKEFSKSGHGPTYAQLAKLLELIK